MKFIVLGQKAAARRTKCTSALNQIPNIGPAPEYYIASNLKLLNCLLVSSSLTHTRPSSLSVSAQYIEHNIIKILLSLTHFLAHISATVPSACVYASVLRTAINSLENIQDSMLCNTSNVVLTLNLLLAYAVTFPPRQCLCHIPCYFSLFDSLSLLSLFSLSESLSFSLSFILGERESQIDGKDLIILHNFEEIIKIRFPYSYLFAVCSLTLSARAV